MKTPKLTLIKIMLISLITGASTNILALPTAVATYEFNNTLSAKESNAPALIPIDPLSQNQFVSDTVLEKNRMVYEFDGNTTSTENAGFYLPTKGILNEDDAFSIEMIFQFKENQSTWENIFGMSNRQNDRAFYVQPNGSLQVWPDDSGAESFVFGEYHHVTLTNDGNGHVTVYIDGKFQFDSTTETVNFSKYTDVNPDRLLHFFVDNIAGGGQNEFSDGRVALIRIYDEELDADDAKDISLNPFTVESTVCTDTNPAKNSCLATYNANGTLSIPCVSVPDGKGGILIYEAEMRLVPLATPLSFELTGAQEK